MPNAFISYRRSDTPFVRRLFDALTIEDGRDIWIDWEDIPPTTDWMEEIFRGIDSADNFVFVISPEAMASEVCNRELAYGISNKKRLVPIIYRQIDENRLKRDLAGQDYADLAMDNWSTLKHINWIFFDNDAEFERSIAKLKSALDTDLDYIQQHTRFLVKAREWEHAKRNPSFVLRGDELRAAQRWLAGAADRTPDPTALHAEYILASQEASTRRQRGIIAAVTFGFIVAIILMFISLWQFTVAQDQREEAQNNAQTAVAAQNVAESNEARAIEAESEARSQLIETQRTQSLFLADLARQQLAAGRFQAALLLGIEALRNYQAGIFNIASGTVLQEALLNSVLDLSDLQHPELVSGAYWKPDSSQILSWSGETVYIWNRDNSGEPLTFAHSDIVEGAVWNADATRVLAWAGENAYIWDAQNGQVLLILPHEAGVAGATFNRNETRVLTWSRDFTVRVWQIASEAPDEGLTPEEQTQLTPVLVVRHGNRVNGARWNSDESRILSWGADGTVRLWNATDGLEDENRLMLLFPHQERSNMRGARWNAAETKILTWGADRAVRIWNDNRIFEFEQFLDSGVKDALWSPNEALLLTIGERSEFAQVWDIAANREVLRLTHDNWIEGALWKSDGSQILSWSVDGTLRLWDAITGRQLEVLEHEGAVHGAQWMDNETAILSWSEDNTARLWNATTAEEVLRLPHNADVEGASWDATGIFLLSWSNDRRASTGDIRVWDFRESPEARVIQHSELVKGALWSNDETRLLTWSQDGTAQIAPSSRLAYQSATLNILTLAHPYDVDGGFWNADDSRIVTWSNAPDNCESDCRYEVYLWNSRTGAILRTIPHTETVVSVSLSPNEDYLLVITDSNTVILWSMTNDTQPPVIFNHGARVTAAHWDRAGNRVLTLGGNAARLWDVESGTQVTFFAHQGLRGAQWSPDESQLLTWGDDDRARVWDVEARAEIRIVQHQGDVRFGTWSVDGERILTTGTDRSVRVWNVATGEMVFIGSHSDTVSFAAWNNDESRILAISNASPFCRRNCTYRVYVWDAESGQVLFLWQHDAFISHAEWSRDESVVLTVAGDGAARLWDAKTGAGRMEVSHDVVRIGLAPLALTAALSDDATQLLTAGVDNTARLWTIDLATLIDLARERANRELSNEERVIFFLPTLTPSVTPFPTSTLDVNLITPTPTITPLPSVTPLASPTPS